MSRANLAWLITVPLLVVLGLAITYSAPEPDPDYKLMRTVADVVATVEKNYYRPLTQDEKQKLIEDMLNGGLAQLDPHSQYLNEKNLELFDSQNQGEFGGIGIVMDGSGKNKYLTVETPMMNSPAYEAGLQPGDVIVSVAGTSTEGMTIEQARDLIKGPAGSTVTLSVRKGAGTLPPEDVILTRGVIPLPVIEGVSRDANLAGGWNYILDAEQHIALIRLSGFNGKTSKDLKAALEAADAQGARSLILDLRDNPGGLLHEAVDVSDIFLASGTIVSTRDRVGGGRSWEARNDNTPWEDPAQRPMMVLINPGSASASEIVAAALADNQRATLVGERTYGKGSVQKIFDLSDRKTAVKLTFEVWLTPKGKNIHRWPTSRETDDWGVFPGPGGEVPLSPEQWKEYVAYKRASAIIPGKPGVAPAPVGDVARPKLPEYKDPVQERARELLHQGKT